MNKKALIVWNCEKKIGVRVTSDLNLRKQCIEAGNKALSTKLHL